MSSSVLVAFATRYGSTQEVAEAVATALRAKGFDVDVRPLKTVRSVEGYGAVVVGAPLQMFRWHKDAFAFLKKHKPSPLVNSPPRMRKKLRPVSVTVPTDRPMDFWVSHEAIVAFFPSMK